MVLPQKKKKIVIRDREDHNFTWALWNEFIYLLIIIIIKKKI